ncbi:MAG: NTP transferase domain-containing protein [Candidatus Synoicihabitans palmerolidicus]|nr:NTP transferase domain-containing protein [Candidatus Synoicihabitans palmerolidicus]
MVVGGATEQIRPLLLRQPVLITENPEWEEGIAASLRAGLRTITEFSRQIENVIFTLCDQPFLNTSVLSTLIHARAQQGKPIVAARYGGQAGATALVHRQAFQFIGSSNRRSRRPPLDQCL